MKLLHWNVHMWQDHSGARNVDAVTGLIRQESPDVEAERWIADLQRALDRGPDLVRTLDAYFRNDMRRADTATDLNIHPRTLDYRLRRARDLTGIDTSTALGVRAFSVAVARALVDG